MAETFTLAGEPGSIRGSAGVWSGFSSQTTGAATDIRGLDTSSFQGDEADTYRTKVSEELPPRLETTSEAWGVVSAALKTYANKLEDLQSRMSTLRAQAAEQERSVSDAQSDLSAARSADAAHTTARQDATKALKPGETLPADTYRAQTGSASSSLTSAQSALQSTIDAAATLRSEHETALTACCGEIDRAKEMRFADPPGFWGKLGQSVGDWISEHADVLTAISSVLKTISGIAGLLALIPCLTPIMGPIALITGGAALVIDVGVKLATGEGSWLQVGVDMVAMIPGMRAAKLAFGAEVGLTSYNVATGNASVADLAMVVGLGSMGLRGGRGPGGRPPGPIGPGVRGGGDPAFVGMPTHVRTVRPNGTVHNRLITPTRVGDTVQVPAGNGSTIAMTRTPNGHDVQISHPAGPNVLDTSVPDGTDVHWGDGSTPPSAPRNPSDDLSPYRSTQPYASPNGVRVSRDIDQNTLAETMVNDMDAAGMNPRVDQGMITDGGMNPNRTDIAGNLNGEQPVHVEYDRVQPNGGAGSRVDGHIDTVLTNDPGSILFTIPTP